VAQLRGALQGAVDEQRTQLVEPPLAVCLGLAGGGGRGRVRHQHLLGCDGRSSNHGRGRGGSHAARTGSFCSPAVPLLAWRDVGVEAEEKVRRVVAVLERDQPRQALAVGGLDAGGPLVGEEVDVQALLRCADPGMLKRRPRSWIRSPWQARRTRSPPSGSLARPWPARNVRAERSDQRMAGMSTLALRSCLSSRIGQPGFQPALVALDSVIGVAVSQVPADRQHDHVGREAEAGQGGAGDGSRAVATSSLAGSLAAGRRSPQTQQRPSRTASPAPRRRR
jgi:hypothetical protein